MKLRSLNLYTRILLWLLVNVAVLGGVFLLVLKWQFREGLQGALGGIAGDRLQVIGQEMHDTLSANAEAEWAGILKELADEYAVQVALVTPPDRVICGDAIDFPAKLKEQLVDMSPGGPPRDWGRPPREGGRPPPPRDELEAFLLGDDFLGEGFPPPPPWPERAGRGVPSRFGTFLLHAGDPPLYYAGVRLPPPSTLTRRDGPLTLIIATRSMTGGGLFFDTSPWLLTTFGAMAISALLWLPFVKNMTSSIRANMKVTEQISKGRFDVRVPEGRGDELGRLAHGINQMAVQLDGLVNGQKRFLGDVAHELCGPISRMEMGLEILEPRLDGGEAFRLAEVRDELRQISALVDELLSFSKATLGQKRLTSEPVTLLPLIEGAIHLEGLPEELCLLLIPEDLKVNVVPDLLRRAVSNLLRNAHLHARGARIEVTATRSKEIVTLTVADEGPGVPEESLPRLFEPFYRVDVARARETGGTGLGLAIVKTCVESCGGNVTARNREPHGLIVLIELPCA
ncbi:two-component system sensor histidine kinase CpxA [Prosthecobacter fusiformis]|uniref:histidine kinase n=1 Tax=Prosthecobacter fusiformis TaxID=48464 RepID=A0A4R7S797_9BACT|nr:HAMP domain-containing sensor histidine kinase [Prosthecobacter fusiformis]TDU73097.1 two-component system sensor histidine kinase CpxA [Prosthecobacter fusiformis]